MPLKMKRNPKKIKNIITLLFVAFLVFWLFQINWDNLFNKDNSGAFLGVFIGIMIVVSLQIPNKQSEDEVPEKH
ncbi:hypothetical protein [Tenacibaculum finnmarkense]|nr:hypothetical protein [Tenacibaculum finnmarkense]MBE7660762.1 hypothetical protein [Tenacibaculum finnmarkense genomovar finnmarkense]MCG8243444.1 hypothetical protein [Tenacibaculum finnmarkense genomovar finnmarkense]MCG8252439.1 hypothetical protein [Tenacibaculum finnmarkense genomovar finnmarkense]MCG8731018.1 hypothetical protein [Tenacibaculum finnmarkense]MCG8752660.1 hypothetical protein [Tenacibaculum finnmarkense]